MSEVINIPTPIPGEEEEVFISRIVDEITNAMDRSAKRYSERLLRHSDRILTAQRNIIGEFQERLYRRWARPLDLLELCIYVGFEAGKEFNKYFRDRAAKKNDHKFEALARLQAAAVRVADETKTLLMAGFASGAHARWRTLHEIAVISSFVGAEGPEVAERYLEHVCIKSWEDAQEYQKYAERLGEEPFEPAELRKIKANYDHVISKYGAAFAKSYGWAIPALEARDPSLRGQNIGFKHLQDAAKIEHWMPYYRMASHAVHPTTKFVHFPLGTRQSGFALLPGRSNADLSEPGQGAVIALGMAIAPLGSYVATQLEEGQDLFQHAFSIQAMIHGYAALIPMTLKAFSDAHHGLERDIEAERNAGIPRDTANDSDEHR